MMKIFLSVALTLLATGCASQARRSRVDSLLASRGVEAAPAADATLSVDGSPKPSPTRALVHSIALPGGGYYYISGYARESENYAFKGTAFLVGELAAFLFAQKQYKDNDSTLPFLLPAVIKLFEFDQVVADAERERAVNQSGAPALIGK